MVDITNTSNLAADRALAYEAIERQPETEEITASNEQETEAKQPGNIGDHVAMYLSQIGSIPIMPQVEANRCIEKAQKGNAAAEQLETLRVIAEESGNAVDPEIEKELMKAIRNVKVNYTEISKFPAVKRDLALLIDKKVQFAEIEKIAYETEKKLLKEVSLFDVYEGKNLEAGKKSYAVSFLLQDENATLNDKQIDKVMQKLIANLQNRLGAVLR